MYGRFYLLKFRFGTKSYINRFDLTNLDDFNRFHELADSVTIKTAAWTSIFGRDEREGRGRPALKRHDRLNEAVQNRKRMELEKNRFTTRISSEIAKRRG
jgi:hypothetical protein